MPLNESSTKLLTRNHVNHKLETILDYPVFFVIAPIGYGKTTAISTFLEKSKYRNIWITMHAPIDISSNEYFWYLIANEIKKYSLEISDSFMDRGFPNDSIQISRIVEFIKNINVKEDIIVVVDDYHLIENEKINLLMKSLIYERIPWLHIILSSRTIPDLAIQELYFKGYCNQINIKDLTFTNNEVKRYLRLVNFKANEKIEQKICEYSNGWFPAIYLMQAYYRQNLKLNTKNSIYSLIKFSFFDKYDETIKMLLINLSILENVNADQAVYIFENDAVIDILNKLCQENAFITIDHQSTYRLHHIYIDFLTELKKEWDDETIKIIQRAARWFSNHGDNILAFKYWFLIKDFKSILQELESEDRNSINFVDRDLIIQIFESVDNELKYQYPIATLKYILIIILYKDRNLGKEMIVPFKHYFDSHTHPKYHKNRIFAELYLLCTSLSFNNARLSAYFSRQAYHLLDGEYSITMNRHDVIAHGFPHFTYAYFKQPGEYKETVKTLSNDFIYLTKATNGLGMGCDILSKAEYSLETGSFDDVESQSLAAFYKSSIFRQTCLQVCAKLNLARLFILQGRLEDVSDILKELNDMRRLEKNTINLDVLDNCIGYINATLTNHFDVADWLQNIDLIFERPIYQGASFIYIIYGKVLILKGEYLKFDQLSDVFHQQISVFQNQLGFIHNYIYKAIARYHLNGIESGAAMLQKAFNIALQDDIIMPFIENGFMLRTILTSGLIKIPQNCMDTILEYINRYPCKLQSKMKDSILTSRETEILALMEQGYSHKLISEKLFISQNTVKRHVQNIYSKLNVHNTISAINKLNRSM